MSAKKFLRIVGNRTTEVAGTVSSAGVGNDGDLVALDATGKLDNSLMPTGIGADTAVIVTSEALADGDFVNIYDVSGTATCRKADASTQGKEAMGFVLASVSSGANATVYFEGTNSHVTGMTAGAVYLSTTPGSATNTAPSSAGNVLQCVGFAISATSINANIGLPITRA